MKNIICVIILLSISLSSFPQSNKISNSDSAAIKQTALDYAEGYYSGNVARVEKAICPDLNKATPRILPQNGRTALAYSTYSTLIENTRAKVGELEEGMRNIQVWILDINLDLANVKINSANFNDYLQMIKIDGQWKIVNVLWTAGTSNPRLKDFKPKDEKEAIIKTASTFTEGFISGDTKRVEMVIDPEFNRVTYNPLQQTGKVVIRRQGFEAMVENTFAGAGKLDETSRDFQIEVLDAMDGLAVVKVETVNLLEFVQMFKSGNDWKIFNTVSKPRPDLTLAPLLPAIVGEPMPDFTLPIYGGGEFTLSKYKGKNVLLMFPRGWVVNAWCSYCPYQYLELGELEKEKGIKKKYDLEMAFVMPYSSERIADWMDKIPDVLQTVENIKNPPAQSNPLQIEYGEWVRKHFPKKFEVKKGEAPNNIPVLVDADRKLSKQLKLFTKFWDGVTSEQNAASVYIIDKKGILQFKYIGQMTEDRPSSDFILNFIKKMD
ncbi:MAG: nuclear transport factor 2 family protein [Ignavibacteriales bacterium]|nr:nuclear transport factor 2 family protein [Ignavibacteriales bacterium]